MFEGKSILAIIPARGGSKGVPKKNIRSLAGKPLISWTIEAAKHSQYIDKVILSSDSQEIIDIAAKWQCVAPFIRPANLAEDNTPSNIVVLHALENVPGYEYFVLLQPTSPLRNTQDIDACIELCIKNKKDSCVSVTESEKSPFWMYTIDSNNHLIPFIHANMQYKRRQDLPKVYVLNGAIYFANTSWFLVKKTFISENTLAFIMPVERSIDIDTEFDLELVNAYLQSNIR